MTDAMPACCEDIELNDVPDMRPKDQRAFDQKAIDAPERHAAVDETAPLVAPGPCYATHLDVGPAQTRARDTVDAVSRCARAAAELRAVEEQYARGLKKVASTLEGAAGPGKGVRGACAAAAAMLTSASEAHATLAKSLAADVEAPLEQTRAAARKTQTDGATRAQAAHRAVKAADDRYRRAASRLKAHARDAPATEAAKPAPGEGSGLDSAADAPPPEKPRASIYARYLAPTKPSGDEAAIARRDCDARWRDLSLEARKSALEAQRLLTAYQALDEAAVETCVDALRKVGVHQESAFSTRNYDLAQLTRALDACDALADVRAFVEEREQARDRVDGACVRNVLRLCQPETSQVARAMGSVFVPRSPVDDVLASPSAVADASTAAVADDVRYVQLPVRAGAGAVASAAACAALLDEASMCTV